MRKYVFIIILFVYNFLNAQIDSTKLTGTWIISDYRSLDSISSPEGFLAFLTFEKDNILTYSFEDIFKVSNEFIVEGDSMNFEQSVESDFPILELSDSLLVFANPRDTIVYTKLVDTDVENTEISILNLLFNYTWEFPNDRNVKLFDLYLLLEYSNIRFYVEESDTERCYLCDTCLGFGFWHFFTYQNEFFLMLSDYEEMNGDGFYQISNIEEEAINLISYSPKGKYDISLKCTNSLDKTGYSEIKQLLTSKSWIKQNISTTETDEYGFPCIYNYYEKGDTLYSEIISGIKDYSHNYPSLVGLATSKILYDFNEDGSYEFYKKSKKKKEKNRISKGTWDLSKDGKYIVLQNNSSYKYYLKIIDAASDFIEFRQIIDLSVLKKSKERYVVDIKIKMK